jgi:type I restriction enzyme S subunit
LKKEAAKETARALSRWKPYPKYKDSGIEWLGEIPEHWETTVLKRLFEVQLGKMLQNEPSSSEDTLEPYLRAANIFWEGVDVSDVKDMWFSPYEKKQYQLKDGDLLISEGGDVGRAALWKNELPKCYIQNAINRIRPRGNHSTRFLYYWIYTLKQNGYIDILCSKATISHFTAEKVEITPVLLLPVFEQRAIADFLDRETAKIDALITKIQAAIDKLKEYRTALISAAVTGKIDVREEAA